jgi:predicted HAD superfamily Cof-like phosphohydrolase
MQRMVQEFQDKYKHNNNKKPTLTSGELNEFRQKLLDEENQELKDALVAKDLVEVADALGDMLYVIFGTCCSHGIDIEPVFEEIHRSNMTKDYSKGECKKQIKGPGYSKPDIKSIIDKQIKFPELTAICTNELDDQTKKEILTNGFRDIK